MSRLGKKPIEIPSTVTIELKENFLNVQGQFGCLQLFIPESLHLSIEPNQMVLIRKNESQMARSFHGLTRVLIQNMILGVTKKFTKILVAEGVGYKFQVEPQKILLSMGFSHPVFVSIPEGIDVKAESVTKLRISGISKEKVGALAAQIRSIRPPEPYKGKGIRYEHEKIRRKAGKTGK